MKQESVRLVSRNQTKNYVDRNGDGVTTADERNQWAVVDGGLADAHPVDNYNVNSDINRNRDVDEFHDGFEAEAKQERHAKVKKFLGIAAVAAVLIAGGNVVAQAYKEPNFHASDETYTLQPGDPAYGHMDQKLAEEWNQDHFNKIDSNYVGYAIQQINGIKDEDGDGVADTPQPGDTFILPEFED